MTKRDESRIGAHMRVDGINRLEAIRNIDAIDRVAEIRRQQTREGVRKARVMGWGGNWRSA